MSLIRDQEEKFGVRCKWLDCDCDCRYTKCVLNWARREVLYDRMRELGLKHPEFAYHVHSESCLFNHDGDFKCLEKKTTAYSAFPDGEDFLTELEREAMKVAVEEYKTNESVKSAYAKGRKLEIERLRGKIAETERKIEELEKEEENK